MHSGEKKKKKIKGEGWGEEEEFARKENTRDTNNFFNNFFLQIANMVSEYW